MTDTHEKILIVEDEPSVAMVFGDMLTNEGYEVIHAGDGEEGLATALKEHPDVILADLKMPKMTGLEMIDALRKDEWGASAKVVILTNASDLSTLQNAIEKGAFHYIVKGDTSMAKVLESVQVLLKQK